MRKPEELIKLYKNKTDLIMETEKLLLYGGKIEGLTCYI